jgi:DNA repair exonuclease SbcCD ATPase subunit
MRPKRNGTLQDVPETSSNLSRCAHHQRRQEADVAVSPDPAAELKRQLQRLHRESGEPSLRAIAARTGAVAHTTVREVLRGERLPRWGPTELVIEAIGGDPEQFRPLWVAARDRRDPQPEPPESAPPGTDLQLRQMGSTEYERFVAEHRRREEDLAAQLLEAVEERRKLFDQLGLLRDVVQDERDRRRQVQEQAAALERQVAELTGRIERLQAELRQVRGEELEVTKVRAARLEQERDEERARNTSLAGRLERLERELAARPNQRALSSGKDGPADGGSWEPETGGRVLGWLPSQEPGRHWRASIIGLAVAVALLAGVLWVVFTSMHPDRP